MNWAESYLQSLAAATGSTVEPSDVARLLEYEAGIKAGTTTQAQLDAHMEALRLQYIKRGASTSHRAYDSQSGLYSDTADPQTEPGYVETRDVSLFNVAKPAPRPVPLASVVTTGGASPSATVSPTVGPTGLAYQDDPVNYSTMATSPSYAYDGLQSGQYGSSGAPLSPGAAVAPRGDNTMIYVALAAAAVAAWYLLKK